MGLEERKREWERENEKESMRKRKKRERDKQRKWEKRVNHVGCMYIQHPTTNKNQEIWE